MEFLRTFAPTVALCLLAACSGGEDSPREPALTAPEDDERTPSTTAPAVPPAAEGSEAVVAELPTTETPTAEGVTPEPAAGAATDVAPQAPAEGGLPDMTSAQVGETGWAYLDRAIPLSARTRGGELADDVCGLEIAIHDPAHYSRCTDTAVGDRLACMAREAFEADEAAYEADRPPGSRQRDRARLLVRDAQRQVSLHAYPVRAIDCVDGVAVVSMGPYGFGSHRELAVIELREGRIATARQLMIDDPNEASSDCQAAWDGVAFVPIVRDGALAGSLVVNGPWSPRFGLGVGEIGQSGVIDSRTRVVAYRERAGILEGVPFDRSLPAECPIVVDDGDGQTNVRPLPNTGRAPVGTLPNGTLIEPVEQRGRWYRIDAPLRGWVFTQSLTRRCSDAP